MRSELERWHRPCSCTPVHPRDVIADQRDRRLDDDEAIIRVRVGEIERDVLALIADRPEAGGQRDIRLRWRLVKSVIPRWEFESRGGIAESRSRRTGKED